jgi:heme A synthase
MFLNHAHEFLSRATSIFTLLVTALALLNVFRRQPIGGDFWGAIAIGEALLVVQGVIGVLLVLTGYSPARGIHFVYGAVSVLTWPAVFALTRGQTGQREKLIWLATSLFLFVITLRAISTATVSL